MTETIKDFFYEKFVNWAGILLLAAIFIFPYSASISGFWFSPASAFIIILFFAALFFIFINPKNAIISVSVAALLFSLIAIYFISVFVNSHSVFLALKAAQSIFMGAALLFIISLFNIKKAKILAWTAAILVGLSSVLGVIQFYSSSLTFYPAYYFGYGKTLYYAAGFANLTTFHALSIIAFLPVLMILFLEEKNIKLKYVLQVIISLAVLNLFFTFSRGAWLAALLTIGALFFLNLCRYKEFLKIGATIAVLILAVLFVPYLNQEGKNHTWTSDLFLSQFDLSYQSQTRLAAAKTTYKIFISKPLTGAGLNKYADYWKKITPRLASDFDRNPHSEPLNTFFEVLVSGGAIGFILFLAILYIAFQNYFTSVFKSGLTRIKADQRGSESYPCESAINPRESVSMNIWALGFALGLAAILIDGLFHTFTYSKLLWFFIGLSFAFRSRLTQIEADRRGKLII